LGRRSVPVWILDSEDALARYSRFARVISLPSVESEPEPWFQALEELEHRFGKCVLLSTTDALCLWLARNKERLGADFLFLTPEYAAIERVIDKRKQVEVARSAQVPIPCTFCPETIGELQANLDKLSYPCLLKPAVSHRGRQRLRGAKLIVAHSEKQLLDAYRQFASETTPFIIQELIPGAEQTLFVYIGFWDSSAQEVAYVTLQKLRQYPPDFGNGSLFQTVEQPRIVEYSRRLLNELRYTGLAEIEFKYDSRTDDFYWIEMNPRAGTMAQVASLAGVDLGWIAYRYLIDGNLPKVNSFRIGSRVMDEEMESLAFATGVRSGSMNLSEWFKSVRKAKPLISAWDDPLPLLVGLTRGFKRMVIQK
jgi:predicted ATP-grasp superfamily ATP-dependent carboligase